LEEPLSLINCRHDWLNIVNGTDPEVARIQREIRRKWLITVLISEHSEISAAVVAARGSLQEGPKSDKICGALGCIWGIPVSVTIGGDSILHKGDQS
jgi:hypothetical protein